MYCPNCGALQPDTHRFCTVCGTSLPRPQPYSSESHVPQKKGSHWVPILILIILSLLGTILYFATAGKEPPVTASEIPWFSVVNGELYFNESKYTGGSELTVPSEINGEPITALGRGCFMECEDLTTVYLPDTIQKIGELAFRSCPNLRGVFIPGSVTEIGEQAFYGCSGLEAVYLNQGLISIGEDTFDECNRLLYIFYSGSHQDWVALYDEFINPFSTVYCNDGTFYQGAPVTP